jgi:hypothetical protein
VRDRAGNGVLAYKVAIIGYTIFLAGIGLIIIPRLLSVSSDVQTITEALGTALVPSGIISLVTEHFLRRDVAEQMSSLFDDYILGHMEELYRSSQNIARLHDANPTAEISEAFSNAKLEILLFNGWIPDFEGLQRGLRAAIQKGVKVKVLLLHPESKLTAQRASEIGIQKAERQSVYTSIDLDNLSRFMEDAGGRSCVEIRLYDELMVAPIYATESEMYIGWFYKARRAVAGPVVRISSANVSLYAAMRDSFFRVWDSNAAVVFYPGSGAVNE